MVIEAQREFQVFLVAGDAVEVGEDLVHAAVLTIEHRLHLFVGELAHAGIHPADGLFQHLERLLVAAELVLI